jgi:hypothetical protein
VLTDVEAKTEDKNDHDEKENYDVRSRYSKVHGKENIVKSLDDGWAYFENNILPRCNAEKLENKSCRKYIRVKPGIIQEDGEKTMLYPIWGTPLQDMADFGIGVGLYFDMLRFFGVVALIAAFISTPTLVFYASKDYSSDGKESIANPANKASAICTNTYWVPCPNCTRDDFNTWPTSLDDIPRVANGTAPAPNDDKEVVFMLKNGCELSETFSAVTLATVFFFCISTFLFIFLQKKMRLKLDENDQTTSDYSIRVKVRSLVGWLVCSIDRSFLVQQHNMFRHFIRWDAFITFTKQLTAFTLFTYIGNFRTLHRMRKIPKLGRTSLRMHLMTYM